jgi:hypothetical protein
VLGRGGFCVVSEVTKITLIEEETTPANESRQCDDEYYIHTVVQDREFMAAHCIRKGKDCRYAIKRMQEASRKDPKLYVNSVVDLAIEARFLSVVRHPNIIKMRAMDGGDPFQPNFFIMLDRLYDIMPHRIAKWKKQQKKGFGWIFDRKGKKEQSFWVERLTVAYDIATALTYLHDLK